MASGIYQFLVKSDSTVFFWFDFYSSTKVVRNVKMLDVKQEIWYTLVFSKEL